MFHLNYWRTIHKEIVEVFWIYLILYIIAETLRRCCHVRKKGPLKCCHVYNLFFKRPARCNVLGESYKNPTRLLKKKKHKNPKQTYAAERKGEPRKRMIEKELRSVIDGREKNLRRKSGFATIRPPYPLPVWSLFFCTEG